LSNSRTVAQRLAIVQIDERIRHKLLDTFDSLGLEVLDLEPNDCKTIRQDREGKTSLQRFFYRDDCILEWSVELGEDGRFQLTFEGDEK